MIPEDILSVDTAPHLDLVQDDEWDGDYNCAYSSDGSRLLDAENFPEEVVVRPGCRILCDGVFAFQDYMAERDHFGRPVPEEERQSFLDKVKLPDSLTHIGREVFRECTWLRSIRLPKSLRVIGDEAFRRCYELESISCPAALLSIGDGAFDECFNLYHVRFNKGLLRIGSRAFNGCESLSELILPAGIEYIGPDAFRGCSDLEAVLVPPGAASRIAPMLPKRLQRILEEII